MMTMEVGGLRRNDSYLNPRTSNLKLSTLSLP
jgi:hypothetical protein